MGSQPAGVAVQPNTPNTTHYPPILPTHPPTHHPPGSLLIEAACSTDRVDEALSTALPLVPGLQYYRCAHAHRPALSPPRFVALACGSFAHLKK